MPEKMSLADINPCRRQETASFHERACSTLGRVLSFAAFSLSLLVCLNGYGVQPVLPNPILFVTQVPVPGDFTTIASVFGNHQGSVESAFRGGDLWIRYPDGTLRNLTREAGFGSATSFQGTNSIAVREPCVHWSGKKALFSMVIGSVSKRYQVATYFWQIYEISGFGVGETPVITKVPRQPANYNNVSPIYGTDDRIIFTSDRPRDGQPQLYPQLDEYEEAPTVTGLWSLDPSTGDLFLMTHVPSGVFSPSVDSFGRVVFVRWDHLQRDQQADTAEAISTYGTFNYSDESASALILTNNRTEIFPEPRVAATGNVNPHSFNQFFPWMIHEDGYEEETLNHIGRHELGGSYRSTSFNDDPNLVELYDFSSFPNTNIIDNFLQMRESPASPGLYFGIDAPEFGTHAGGQLVALHGPPTLNPDLMKLDYLTPRATASTTPEGHAPPPSHTGFYRNPLPLSDGRLACVHTPETLQEKNIGTDTQPLSRYDFRLKLLKQSGAYWAPDVFLTPGMSNSVSWWDPDTMVSYSGLLWELDPVEVKAQARPARLQPTLENQERSIFADEGISLDSFQTYLEQRNLALLVVRNVTARDHKDKQQPYNLRIPGGAQTIGKSGKIYDISHFQLFQADQIRGTGLVNSSPRAGRRPLAQYAHDPLLDNPADTNGPTSSVLLASDGSAAAIVPARRALSWQLTAPDGTPVVRERYWITFQPGEIRACTSCHGVNTKDQAGRAASTNSPLALRQLLQYWKGENFAQQVVVTNNGVPYLGLTFKRQLAATNIAHTVEVSDDMIHWADGSRYTGTNVTPNTPTTTEVSRTGSPKQIITVRDNQPLVTRTNLFLRVRDESP